MFIVDAHLDLSMNAMEWNRDLRNTVAQINEREKNLKDKPGRGNASVSIPELRNGNIGLVVATQIARFVEPASTLPGWNSPQQAWAQTQGQLAWYRSMEDAGELVQIVDKNGLNEHLELWEHDLYNIKPVGYILSLEGADSIISIEHLQYAWNYGLRAIGPAHYGPGRYANGTDASGKMNQRGKNLLSEMERLNIILDVTHLCDDAFWQAMEWFNGPIWASHNNARSLVDHNRQFSDQQFKTLIQKGAVIGAALDAWMLVPGWVRGQSNPIDTNCSLDTVARHIDHICQIAGNADHVGIGSDLDGGFGTEQCPHDLSTIADLQKLINMLEKYGYSTADIEKIMNTNWITFLRNNWND